MKSGHVSICEIEVKLSYFEEVIETNDKIQFRHFYKRFSLQKAFQLPNSNYRSIDTKTEQPIKHNQYIYAILVIQNYQKS